jgi:hypothetical protein
MPFSPLASIVLSEAWQVTPATEGNYFKFIYGANLGFSYLAVAQAQVSNGNGLELFGAFRFALKGQGADVAQLEIPRVFDPGLRCLAVRGIGALRLPGKSLDLTIEATTMLIINPAGNTTKERKTDFLQSDNAGREMVPANLERNGGTIFNKGTKALWVGFGVNAEKSSPNKILPGGQMDIPHGFTGVINGIFESADATPNNTSKAIVEEMVAS